MRHRSPLPLRLPAGPRRRSRPWAEEPDVKMIVMAPIGPHLVQPRAVAGGVVAERPLDRGIDENALDFADLRPPP